MPFDLLMSLEERIEDDLDGLALVDGSLKAVNDARYGEVTLSIDHDEEAASLRVSVAIPPPAGAGTDFLIWCLATNMQYWDVKIGLDDDGQLVIHADLDADEDTDLGRLGASVVDRAETILDLLDDDLTTWALEHGLGTPAQRERWVSRASTPDDGA